MENVLISAIIEMTKKCKASGLTGEQTFNGLKSTLIKMSDISEKQAAQLIRKAWKQAI